MRPSASLPRSELLTSVQLNALVIAALEDLKGQDIVSLDISPLTTIADYMVVVTGTSNRHVKSLADEVLKRGKEAGLEVRIEGQEQGEWVLLDLGDVIVHVMQAATRKLYDLESLWKQAPGEAGA
jgi:iojap-like ribosome-associated protein